MASVKRVLGGSGRCCRSSSPARSVCATRSDAAELGAEDVRRGRRPDAGTIVGSGRGDRRRHVDDPSDGSAVVHRVGRSLRAHVRRTRRGRRVLRPGRLARRSHAPSSGADRGPGGAIARAPRRARGAHLRQWLGPGRRRTGWRTVAIVLRQPCRAGSADATPRRTAALARRRPRPEHGTGARPPDAPRPPAPRGTRRQRGTAGAPAARAAGGGVRSGSDVRVERLPGQQRARSDAVDLGHPPAAVVAPRRTGRARRRRARPVARLVRVQPPGDARGRPGLRDRARPAGRSGGVAAGGRAGGAVETPAAPGAVRRARHDRPAARVAAGRTVPRAEGAAVHRGRTDRPHRRAGGCGRTVAPLGRAVDPVAATRPPHHRTVVRLRRTPLVHTRVERPHRRRSSSRTEQPQA